MATLPSAAPAGHDSPSRTWACGNSSTITLDLGGAPGRAGVTGGIFGRCWDARNCMSSSWQDRRLHRRISRMRCALVLIVSRSVLGLRGTPGRSRQRPPPRRRRSCARLPVGACPSTRRALRAADHHVGPGPGVLLGPDPAISPTDHRPEDSTMLRDLWTGQGGLRATSVSIPMRPRPITPAVWPLLARHRPLEVLMSRLRVGPWPTPPVKRSARTSCVRCGGAGRRTTVRARGQLSRCGPTAASSAAADCRCRLPAKWMSASRITRSASALACGT